MAEDIYDRFLSAANGRLDALERAHRAESAAANLSLDVDRLTGRVKTLEAQIATMNARIATDAKAYERDQYLISQLRRQLREARGNV